jgi:Nodulation protein Z (NodZ)
MCPSQPLSATDRSRRVFEEHTLVVTAWNAGFFSHINRVVNHLHHSLGREGCAAVRVEWHVSENTPLFVYGTAQDGELWRRFFEPLSFPNAPRNKRITSAYADLSMTGLHAYRMYKRGAGWRTAYGRAFAEHVHVREELRRRVDELWQDVGVGGRCVGVHFRHAGHGHECPRAIPQIDAVVDRTRRQLKGDGSATVVLATDVREAVEGFRDAFGEQLLVQPDVARAPAAMTQYDWGLPPCTALGEQALIDALLLARCDVLLHTTSNLATAVGYMNPRLRMIYCEPRLVGMSETVRARFSPQREATIQGVSRRQPNAVG